MLVVVVVVGLPYCRLGTLPLLWWGHVPATAAAGYLRKL